MVRVPSHPSLAQSLADALRRAILAGEYRPGDRLPPERKLAEQQGVSRGTVREPGGVEEGLLRLLAHRRQRILALVEVAQVGPG